jgi:hypothetical protein
MGDSFTISPGGGNVGSLSWRFMSTVERLLPAWEDCRFLVTEVLEEPGTQLLAWVGKSANNFVW